MKNASSLLDDKDPLKLEAESKLSDLIRYVFLGYSKNQSSLMLEFDAMNHVSPFHFQGKRQQTAC